jgi:hypothetical protein
MGPSRMGRSRTDEILEGWKMTSHSAQRPAEPPAPDRSRIGLPLGLVAAGVLVILALVVGSRMLSSGPGPVLPAVGASAPAATATEVPTTAPTASAAHRPSPSAAASAASGSPSPADVAAAREAVDTYTAKLKAGDTSGAWQMLAPKEQLKYASTAQYASERYAFFQGVKSYTVTPDPKDVNPIRAWLAGTNGATINLAHAVLVEVRYKGVTPPADWDLYIVNPTANGLEIYSVR